MLHDFGHDRDVIFGVSVEMFEGALMNLAQITIYCSYKMDYSIQLYRPWVGARYKIKTQ